MTNAPLALSASPRPKLCGFEGSDTLMRSIWVKLS